MNGSTISSAGRLALIVAVASFAQACSDTEESPSSPFSDGGSSVYPDSGSSGGTTAGGTTGGGGLPGGTLDSGVTPGSSTGLPCAVRKVVADKCLACHSDPPIGTYMALTTQAHWQAPSTTDGRQSYAQLAKTRINLATGAMPPATSPALTADEKATLNAWLDQGAPASTEACGTAGAPDAGTPPPGPVDTTGLECVRMVAHAPGNKSAKFKVGAVKDAYWFFGFKPEWQGKVYGLVIKPVIDNAKVLHHWLLYKENVADGAVNTTIGQHQGGELLFGWAPGGVAMDLRKHPDVSLELEASTNYGLELHYNSGDAKAEDASGVEICFQRTPTQNIAAMSWLGYDQGGLISYGTGGLCLPAATWQGTCRPAKQQPVHLIYQTPHMHQAGRHMKSIINGRNGPRVLHDAPFDFNYQVSYEIDEVLMPGETITTTCEYSEPKCSGQATNQEMCYNFVYAYPKGILTDNMNGGRVAHGQNVCLGQ